MNVQSSKLSLQMIEFGQVLKKTGYQYQFGGCTHQTRNIGCGVMLEMCYKKLKCAVEYWCSALSNKFGHVERQAHIARKAAWPGRAAGLWEFFPEVAHTPWCALRLTVSFCTASRWPCLRGTFPCGNTSTKWDQLLKHGKPAFQKWKDVKCLSAT